MADSITSTLGIDTSGMMNGLFSAGNYLYYFMLVILFGAFIMYIMWFTSFNKTIRIKRRVNGVIKIRDFKCALITRKDGESFLQIRHPNPAKKELHPAPPNDVIELGNKGKEFMYAYQMNTGELIYAKDRVSIPEVPQEILNIKDFAQRFEAIAQWKKDNKVIDAFKPITTNQRTFYLNQIKQANNKTKMTIMDRITQLAPMFLVVIALAIFLIFGGKFYEPAIKLSQNVIDNNKIMLQIVDKMDSMDKKVQKIVPAEPQQVAPPQ